MTSWDTPVACPVQVTGAGRSDKRTVRVVQRGCDVQDYDEFFSAATGQQPYPYQIVVADSILPPVLCAPTGAGKTAAIVLAWLWRRHAHPDSAVRAATPRRLVIALPMRVLVDQTADAVTRWVTAADLDETIDVHVVMGGHRSGEQEWRRNMHRSSILIGTADMIVSKLLVRAYGASRSIYPLDFALLGNGSHLVLDEIQLMPAAAGTLRQMAAFARRWPTAEPFGVTLMSATVDHRVLDTVDNPWGADDEALTISDADRTGLLRKRLIAPRLVAELDVDAENPRTMAKEVAAHHRAGTRTLVVVNTVKSAVELYKAVGKLQLDTEVVLAHSRFRPQERTGITTRLLTEIGSETAGVIVIATQVIEAGVDLESATLITEAAPWPSIVQRAGRCNRTGGIEDARLLWTARKQAAPYEESDVAASVAQLRELAGTTVTTESLLAADVATIESERSILRAPDFLGLFDTAPDLSGGDVDVSPYIRPGTDLDVYLAWVPFEDGKPAGETLPPADARCPVPVGELRTWAGKGNRVWVLDAQSGNWDKLTDLRGGLRPGLVLVADAAKGGYMVDVGFSPASTAPVDLVDEDRVQEAVSVGALAADIEGADVESGATAQPGWVTVPKHLADAAEHATSLLAVLGDPVSPSAADAVVTAALLHDLGKAAHPWADALMDLADETTRATLTTPPYAKSSDGHGRLNIRGRRGFRHELVSTLILARNASPEVSFLVRYLVAAHHGRIRLQARDVTGSTGRLFGLTDGEQLELYQLPPVLPGLDVPATLSVDLSEFSLGGEASWTREALGLLDEHGPFVLAYLELLVRMADWRSSADQELAEATP